MSNKYLKKNNKKKGGADNDTFSTPTGSVQGPLFINTTPNSYNGNFMNTPNSFGTPLTLGTGDLSVPSTITTQLSESPASVFSANTSFSNNSLQPINLQDQFMAAEEEEDDDEEEEDPMTDVEMEGGKRRKTKKSGEMSSKTLKYCPYMHINKDGKYASVTKSRPHILSFNGKKYRFYTCCRHCCQEFLKHAKDNPKTFAKTYIDHIDGKKLYLKHRQTGKIVQIAYELSSSIKKHTKNKTKKRMTLKKQRKTRNTKKIRKKQKGGVHYKTNIRWGNGYGANCNDPNNNIYNTNLLKLFPYKPN